MTKEELQIDIIKLLKEKVSRLEIELQTERTNKQFIIHEGPMPNLIPPFTITCSQ